VDQWVSPESDVRMIAAGRAKVGIVGLTAVFEEMKAAGREPTDELADEFVGLAARSNYVPDSARAEYARALLAEYRRFLGEDVPEERAGLSIKVLGAGCPRCEKLAADVMATLEKLGLPADVEHVRDPARIGEHGVLGTPALVVNGKVVAAGRTPSAGEIEGMLLKGERDVR
jgi:small redox-active disulfide protein 2